MSEMIDKVAAAIDKAGNDWLRAQTIQRSWFSVPREVLARAAIEAMREPTEAMATLAKGALTGYPRREMLESVHRAMIDAALTQGTEARRAETGTGSVHDGPVGEADAP